MFPVLRPAVAMACLFALPAHALPVIVSLDRVVDASYETPGVEVGDAMTVRMTLDNGGTSLVDQTFDITDLVTFSLTAGDLVIDLAGGDLSGGYIEVATDATGAVTSSSTFQIEASAVEATWPGVALLVTLPGGPSVAWDSFSHFIDDSGPSDLSDASIAFAPTSPVPLPPAMALLGAGVLALGALRRGGARAG